MQQFAQLARNRSARLGRARVSVLVIATLVLGVSVVSGFRAVRADPKIKVETQRSADGARITMNGQDFAPAARIVLTSTRFPAARDAQSFGTVSADAAGKFAFKKTVGCTTNNTQDGEEKVTFTATDSASGAKATSRVDGGAWVCQ